MKRAAMLVLLLVGACTAKTNESDPTLPLDLEGAYVSDIDELQLSSDATYRYRAELCEGEDCEQLGTYTFDERSEELRLTSQGVTHALPLTDAELETVTEDDPSIQPANLIEGPSKLLTKRSRLLRGRLGNRTYTRQQGGCSPRRIADAQASCKAQCPGGSKGLDSCTPSKFSCACKAGSPPELLQPVTTRSRA